MDYENINHAEDSLIALMLQDSSVYRSTDISGDWFISPTNRSIYRTIGYLIDNNRAVDHVTVADTLTAEQPNVNWFSEVIGLAENVLARPENINTYTTMLKDKYVQRSAKRIAMELMQTGEVDAAITALMDLGKGSVGYEYDSKSVIKEAVKRVEEAFEAAEKGELTGIDTGLIDLNDAIGGWHETDLCVIPARPAMGKTAALLNFAMNCNVPFGVISTEQAHDQLGMRLLSIEGGVSGSKVRRGKMVEDDWSKLTNGAMLAAKKQFWVNDDPSITIEGIKRQARKWVYQNGVKVLFVDYIQHVAPTDKSQPKHIQVEEVTKGLKALAKELRIPVVALAQVNRDCEKRDNKRPYMGDIAEASIIEKEADLVMTLYRDEVYNPETPDKGIAEFIVCKNRHGPIGTIRAQWNGATFKLSNLSINREYF